MAAPRCANGNQNQILNYPTNICWMAKRSRTLRLLRSDDGENFTEHLLPLELQFNGDGGKLYIADYDGNGKNNDILVQRFANEALLYNVDFQPVLDPVLNADDYLALKALYTSTSGENWRNNFG
ncbi:MAG: hypothetical protein EBE86_010110 [Hormoscilla sp. GUM202]|nr:hypothetical protein [Hormoscilla sp. GUM202]